MMKQIVVQIFVCTIFIFENSKRLEQRSDVLQYKLFFYFISILICQFIIGTYHRRQDKCGRNLISTSGERRIF